MLDFASRVLSAEKGKTHLFSVGQAGFIIKSASDQLLGIDLYLSECVERVEGHIGFKRLLPSVLEPSELVFDLLITTHFHRDHFDIDAMPTLMKNKKTHLFTAYDCATDVKNLGIDEYRVTYVKAGDQKSYGDFNINIVKCDHGKNAPHAVGVIVTVDGKKIYETGDTCLHKEWAALLPKDIDVMIAPINGAYGNLNEEECAEYSEAVKPKVTIPCHYGMFASHGGNPGKFHDLMSEKSLPYYLMCVGEQYTLNIE